MFFRRGVADDDPWLGPKLWLFSIGAALALLGMGTRTRWLIGLAAVVLAAGVLIRFVPHPGDARRDDEADAPAKDNDTLSDDPPGR